MHLPKGLSSAASVDSETLIRTACETASAVEPWFTAKSAHPVLQDMIPRVQTAGIIFYDALDISKDASMQGILLAQNFLSFWELLTDERISIRELQEWIGQMAKTAGDAHNFKAKLVSKQFTEARSEIFAITSKIPLELTCLVDEEIYHKKKLFASEKKVQYLKVAKVVSTGCAAIVGVVAAGVTFPPALIALPIMLPLLAVVIEGAQMRVEKKMKERETKIYECKAAIAQLEYVAADLAKFERCIDQFALFWKHIENDLHLVEGRIHRIREDRSKRLEFCSIKNSFQGLEKSLCEYNAKLGILKAYDPKIKSVPPKEIQNDLDLHLVKSSRGSSESLSSQATLINEDRFLGPPKSKDGSRSPSPDSRRFDSSNASRGTHKSTSDRGVSSHEFARYKDRDIHPPHRRSRSRDRLSHRSRYPRSSRDHESPYSSDEEQYPSSGSHYDESYGSDYKRYVREYRHRRDRHSDPTTCRDCLESSYRSSHERRR
ncbi:hypothetical protein C0991_007376 [Blastosporella zonata]|nr:hypothetical protein C0991_007376 [Blastosporella zonata]